MEGRPATELAPPEVAGAPPDAPTSGRDRRFVLAAVGVGVLAALAYLPNLTTGTLLIDERVYLEAGAAYLDGDFGLNPEHPPLAKLLFGLAGRVVGDPVLGGRLVAVASGVAIAVAVFALVRRAAGRWWGLAGAGLWVVLPHALRHAGLGWGGFDRLDRFAMLDPVATAFAMAALVVAVHWSDDHRLRWGLLAGALVGLAAGAKLSGGLMGVVVAAVPWVSTWSGRASWTTWAGRAATRSVVVGATAIAAAAACYLPLGGEAVEVFRTMVEFQSQHAAGGHDVVVAGQAYPSAPWWAQGWYAWRDEGALVTVALAVAGVLGAVAGPGRPRHRALIAAAVVVPAAVFAASPVLLPYYRFLWLPALVAVATLGIAGLAGRRGVAPRLLAAVLVGALVVTGLRSIAFVTTRDTAGYRAAAEQLTDRGLGAPAVLVAGFPRLLTSYLPDATLVDRLRDADAVVLDPVRTDLRPVPGLRDRLAQRDWVPIDGVVGLDVWVRR